MKNKILNRWSIIISSVLSFFGIFIGSFACVYGPQISDEGIKQLYDLKAEVEQLQDKLHKKETEKSSIQRDLVKYEEQMNLLQREKDSLLILIDKFDK
jgi:septal ring factor EnvC (AmiA/AmiB activator)